MSRGRRPIGPPATIAAPRAAEDDPDALIDTALQGWIRDARVKATWPEKVGVGSWIDGANHPRNSRQRGRPEDHYLPLLIRAIELLRAEHGWTTYHPARVYVADRLLAVLPLAAAMLGQSDADARAITETALGIPRSVFCPKKCPTCGSGRVREVAVDAYECQRCLDAHPGRSTRFGPLAGDARHAAARNWIIRRLTQQQPPRS